MTGYGLVSRPLLPLNIDTEYQKKSFNTMTKQSPVKLQGRKFARFHERKTVEKPDSNNSSSIQTNIPLKPPQQYPIEVFMSSDKKTKK